MFLTFTIIDIILFVVLLLVVLYLLTFSVASLFYTAPNLASNKKQNRIVVLFPAYHEDAVIVDSVRSALDQTYPSSHYTTVVIADGLQQSTCQSIARLGAEVLTVTFEHSSKAKALAFAAEQLQGRQFDIAVILDADNHVTNSFLEDINRAYSNGANSIQAHRCAKNLDSDTALLDALSEEINNSIFRSGHVALGFSSALIGSGMAFDYTWFVNNIHKTVTAGEDKELERLLLRDRQYITYLRDTPVYDQKIATDDGFYNQRRRWLAAQVDILFSSVRELPSALFSGNWDYVDKLIQWMLPPRSLTVGLIGLCSVVATCVQWQYSVKWWAMLLVLLFALSFAVPDCLVTRPMRRALRRTPLLAIYMFFNLFRLRGVNKKFIHTQH